MQKKILYIKAQGLGDIIGGIPFLVQQKQAGNKVYQTFYDMRYLHRGLQGLSPEQKERYKTYPMYQGWYNILEILKASGLIEEIIFIPYNKRSLLKLFRRYFRYFDQAIIPIKTWAARGIAYICAKTQKIIFEHRNDIHQFRTLSTGECGGKVEPLHHYLGDTDFPMTPVSLGGSYVTIFPSIRERSLDIEHWISTITHILSSGYRVVIIGGKREQRFVASLREAGIDIDDEKIINLLDKVSLPETFYLLKHATLTVSGNGGPMWIANLVNKYCINIHTTSSYLMEPPVDHLSSYNVRKYHYPQCAPCESAESSIGKTGMPSCVFHDTSREGECRKANTAEQIIFLINKILASM